MISTGPLIHKHILFLIHEQTRTFFNPLDEIYKVMICRFAEGLYPVRKTWSAEHISYATEPDRFTKYKQL